MGGSTHARQARTPGRRAVTHASAPAAATASQKVRTPGLKSPPFDRVERVPAQERADHHGTDHREHQGGSQ